MYMYSYIDVYIYIYLHPDYMRTYDDACIVYCRVSRRLVSVTFSKMHLKFLCRPRPRHLPPSHVICMYIYMCVCVFRYCLCLTVVICLTNLCFTQYLIFHSYCLLLFLLKGITYKTEIELDTLVEEWEQEGK
jgi:hypothetical protein